MTPCRNQPRPFAIFALFAALALCLAPLAQAQYTLNATDFPTEGTNYLKEGKWLTIDQTVAPEASTKTTVPAGNTTFRVDLHVVGENDGQSTYEVLIADRSLGVYKAPYANNEFEEGPHYVKTWDNVSIDEGVLVTVKSKVGQGGDQSQSLGRWSKIVFTPLGIDPGRAKSDAAKLAASAAKGPDLVQPRKADGDGSISFSGELKQWHAVTLDLSGPYVHENDRSPNPFLDYSMFVTFAHESGAPVYTVPGYFAADGDAANTSANSGTVWRAHVSPDKAGEWRYRVHFAHGKNAAIDPSVNDALAAFDGKIGTFNVAKTDKTGRDFRAKGRLQYVGGHYLRFAGDGSHFLKAGADAPETYLAYVDFDNTVALKKGVPLKTWAPHAGDFNKGDPTWQNGKGKNLIGSLNYLASKGANIFSFLTYNAGGDGDNIWPFVERDDKFHYDCSKLDQWGIVFAHAQAKGIYLHFKLQENELDDNRQGAAKKPQIIPESMDGGLLGPERKLYLREIIARYGHHLALNWNLGEENTQSYEEQTDMANYIDYLDAYDHNVVIHTFPSQQDDIYPTLLGAQSAITGASLQNSWSAAHQQTLRWVYESDRAGKPWVVANDEQNPAQHGVPPDIGYKGWDGRAGDEGQRRYTMHDIRKYTLWGNLMAGGAGVEYYFGYKLMENDLVCEDLRSRDKSWEYCSHAIDFFQNNKIAFWGMRTENALVGNPKNDNSKYCFASIGRTYVVYLPDGGSTDLDLSGQSGSFKVQWYNPRTGGELQSGSLISVEGGSSVSLGNPPADASEDWTILVTR